MRERADAERIHRFMQALGAAATRERRAGTTPRLLRRIEPELYRFPAIEAADFRQAVEDAL